MAISEVIRQFAAEYFGDCSDVCATSLRGGLESDGVARYVVRGGGKQLGSFVAKPIDKSTARELRVYRLLQSTEKKSLAPALLGWRRTGRHTGYLFLEWVHGAERWPWANLQSSTAVVDRLAALHKAEVVPCSLPPWDYDRELARSAATTLAVYRSAFLSGIRPGGRPMLQALTRVVEKLPELRQQLAAFTGTTLLHGDAHPGNVLIGRRGVTFIDWSRARIGSPLEDLCSWVQTLSFWEVQARRKHDTLLSRYRQACGHTGRLTRDFRDACFLAGASNALAGALRYHLLALQDLARSPRQRVNSYRAAADWLRLVRRTDEVLRSYR